LLDRPHILYNSRTKQFVCWVNVMGKTAQTRTVLVADKIIGPYTIVHKDTRPLSMSAGDFDLVVSPDDGKAHVFRARPIARWSPPILLTIQRRDGLLVRTFRIPDRRPFAKGTADFRRRGQPYLATSGTTG